MDYSVTVTNHGDNCHGNRGEELVHELPVITGGGATVNMEKLMSHSEDDDHSGGQEETRGNRLHCVI